jgi:uncharacterized protein
MKHFPLRNSIRMLCVLLLCVAFGAGAVHGEDIKKIKPAGYVTDLAGVIDSNTKARLEALCTEVEQKTGAQMAIVTVHSLEGEQASQYGNELYKQLGVGGKKDDRGVLLLVAPEERKYWTEVGYGLEPTITDARAGDAGRAMVPQFRAGNFGGAIETGAWVLAKYIADAAGVTLSGQPPARPVYRRSNDNSGMGLWLFLGFIVLVIVISSIGYSGRGGGSGGSGLMWFILGMLANSGGGSSRGSSWGGGGFGGGSGGGGGFGGFGGGSSGGGGAGGSW